MSACVLCWNALSVCALSFALLVLDAYGGSRVMFSYVGMRPTGAASECSIKIQRSVD
jgi:hypothetical protein